MSENTSFFVAGPGLVTCVSCPVLHEMFSNICALSPLGANSSLPLHV